MEKGDREKNQDFTQIVREMKDRGILTIELDKYYRVTKIIYGVPVYPEEAKVHIEYGRSEGNEEIFELLQKDTPASIYDDPDLWPDGKKPSLADLLDK